MGCVKRKMPVGLSGAHCIIPETAGASSLATMGGDWEAWKIKIARVPPFAGRGRVASEDKRFPGKVDEIHDRTVFDIR